MAECGKAGADSQSWYAALRENGYRLTDARMAVVDVVVNSACILRPAEVFDYARHTYPHLGLVTVYRTLEKLEELGLIQRVHRDEDCQAFVPTRAGHHHLLLCKKCGKYVYFEGTELEILFSKVEEETGFVTQEHWMQLFGICPQCQAEDKGSLSRDQ